jgi:hypothetical protein
METVPTRRGFVDISEDNITVLHSLNYYALNVLSSWHGLGWGVGTAVLIGLFLQSGSGTAGAIAGFSFAGASFFLFLMGMHVLRFDELPVPREHSMDVDEIDSIEKDVAMNAESPSVLEIYEINYSRDGEQFSAVVLPRRKYQDRMDELLDSNGYQVEE